MPAHTTHPDLANQILRVSSTKKGLSGNEIHEKIKRFYPLNCAPGRATVYRVINKLIKEQEMYEGDDGFLKKEAYRSIITTFWDSHPNTLVRRELTGCLAIMAMDPEDNAAEIKMIVEERISPLLNQMRLIIELVDRIMQSPEIVAWDAKNNERIKAWMGKYDAEQLKEFETEFWNDRDTYGEYMLGPIQKEIP